MWFGGRENFPYGFKGARRAPQPGRLLALDQRHAKLRQLKCGTAPAGHVLRLPQGTVMRRAPRAALRPFGPRRRRRAPGPRHRPRQLGAATGASASTHRAQAAILPAIHR